MKNNFKFILIALISLLVIITSFAVIYLVVNTGKKNTKTTVNTVDVEDVVWKKYTDYSKSFYLTYPPTWTIKSDFEKDAENILEISSPASTPDTKDNPTLRGDSDKEIFSISYYYSYKYFLTNGKEVIEFLSDKTIFSNFEKVEIGKTEAYKVERKIGDKNYVSYYITRGDEIFIFSTSLNFSKVALDILNSFKFI